MALKTAQILEVTVGSCAGYSLPKAVNPKAFLQSLWPKK